MYYGTIMNNLKPQSSQRTQSSVILATWNGNVFHRNPSAFICVHLRLIFVSLYLRFRKIQNELFLYNLKSLHTLWCLILIKNKPQIPGRASEGRRHVCPAGIQGLRPLRTRPRMPAGIRVHAIDWRGSRRRFPLPKGNRDADERRLINLVLKNYLDFSLRTII